MTAQPAIDLMHEVKSQQSAAATSWGRKTRRSA